MRAAPPTFNRCSPAGGAQQGRPAARNAKRSPLASRRDSRLSYFFRRAGGEPRRPTAVLNCQGGVPGTPFVVVEVFALCLCQAKLSTLQLCCPRVHEINPLSYTLPSAKPADSSAVGKLWNTQARTASPRASVHELLPICNALRMFLDKKLQVDFSLVCELPELTIYGWM
jgi:hypothetical protein